jgi:hypothetical protein
VTLLPLRAARKSVGGFCNSSEGASGGPIDAHPLNQIKPPTTSNNFPKDIFMPKQTLHPVSEKKLATLIIDH